MVCFYYCKNVSFLIAAKWSVNLYKVITMPLAEIKAQCQKCSNKFTQVPKQSFLGFQKVKCTSCEKKTTYPLTSGYRIIYWILLALMILVIIRTISEGGFAFPGGLGIAIIFALIRDSSIKKKITAP